MRWIAVWRRNFLVWRKLFAAAVLTNLADPLIMLFGLGYGLGALLPSVEGMSYIAFFAAGNTMLTAALEACVEQTIWLANPWILPPFESPVLFVFARERLDSLPESLHERVPAIDADVEEADGDR